MKRIYDLSLSRVKGLRKALWILVIIGLACSLPLIVERHRTEDSANKVELVMDYRDIVDISNYKQDPAAFIQDQMQKMKEAGIKSLAVYESSLTELESNGRIRVYSQKDAASLTKTIQPSDRNNTYVLFTDANDRDVIRSMVEDTFKALDVSFRDWTVNGVPGIEIDMPYQESTMKPMNPDPVTLEYIKDNGYTPVVRLSDRRQPFDKAQMESLFAELEAAGVKRIIFDGDAVTGFDGNAKNRSLQTMADLMKQHGIGLAAIEMLKSPQKGMSTLAYLTDYNVVRLHSLPENKASSSKEEISDRLTLAVKDRNIRMIFLNSIISRNVNKAKLTDPLDNLYTSLKGSDGAIHRIEDAGFTMGTAQAFDYDSASWHKPLKLVVLLGGIALIALAISFYLPGLAPAIFLLGLIGSAGLYVLSSEKLLQMAALGIGICAPVLAVILAVQFYVKRGGRPQTFGRRFTVALIMFVRSILVSLIGVAFIVALLSNITYMLVIEQFRGVSLLHLAPIALIALYVLVFNGKSSVQTVRRILFTQINVLLVVAAGVAGIAVLYYLSRTGNAGQASSYERVFRTFLENTFGVRPRTKEFLFAHPLFIAAAYMSAKYRSALYVFIGGVIGQLSVVDTFAHLHTPLDISLIRITLGACMGILVSLVYIFAWELAVRGWKRWAPMLKG